MLFYTPIWALIFVIMICLVFGFLIWFMTTFVIPDKIKTDSKNEKNNTTEQVYSGNKHSI